MSPTLKTEAFKQVVVGGRMSPTLKTEASKQEESKALMAQSWGLFNFYLDNLLGSESWIMEIKKLTPHFYNENGHLKEVLEKQQRGYGLAIISINNLRFGIPIRTTLHRANKYCFKTIGDSGLDYTKAVLLEKDAYISGETFKVKSEEFTKIKEHDHFIQQRFEKYVMDYIKAHKKKDARVIDREFRYSTLINYHKELGL